MDKTTFTAFIFCSVMAAVAQVADDFRTAVCVVDLVTGSDEWEDCIDDAFLAKTNYVYYSSFDEIFAAMPESEFPDWSLSKKMQSFDQFLDGVSQTNRTISDNEYQRIASYSLIISLGKSYTNAIAPSKEILKAQNAPCKYYALELVLGLMPPSLEKNEIMYAATTNSVDFDAPLRHLRMYEYVDQLCKLNETNQVVVTNAALLFYRNRAHVANYLAADRLFKAAYPGYATSSNRSAICEMAYASSVTTPFDRNYFDGVTNELANAPQPLGGVPELDAATE